MISTLLVRGSKAGAGYPVFVGTGLIDAGEYVRQILGEHPKTIAVISNPVVADLYAQKLITSLERVGYKTFLWFMRDGERYKNFRSLEESLRFLSASGIGRSDAVLALGGGVVGDLAGFASSVYLRGIPFVQVPTTLLAMIDSSVGGKTGINTDLGKNLVGSFHPPAGVIVDTQTLETLPHRELTAGFCEAVKHAAISGKSLFGKTESYLAAQGAPAKSAADLVGLVKAQIAFKASIVRQDEKEDPRRTDPKSRKILNFGHTFAHALERITNYRYFRHGEAVGHGIIFASQLSKILEILDEDTVKSLNDVVHRTGTFPSLRKIDPQKILEAFQYDKKFIGGSLQWILLAGIGKPVILSGTDVPTPAIKKAIRIVFDKKK